MDSDEEDGGQFLWGAVVPGDPVGKGRPRASTRGGHVRLYTPPRTAHWEGVASTVFHSSWGRAPLDCPVEVRVLALFRRPKRLVWKRRPMVRLPYVSKPDASNVLKAAEDALEKAGVLRDDCLIYKASIVCFYCSGEEAPQVSVTLKWYSPETKENTPP